MSQPHSAAQDRFKLRSVAFFGRTLAEYLSMLALGLDATGCDPMYAHDSATIAAPPVSTAVTAKKPDRAKHRESPQPAA